ncbi:MAG: hypothetical protein Q7K11_01325 [Candidatus Berkelbacteria bacterium]|nr:hypothetical protein [Candidatus Berkelbacteria bacterium]
MAKGGGHENSVFADETDANCFAETSGGQAQPTNLQTGFYRSHCEVPRLSG